MIMKYLVRHGSRKSHPPPRAHSSRILGAFVAVTSSCGFPPQYGRRIHTITSDVKAATQDAGSRDRNPYGLFPATPIAGTLPHRAGCGTGPGRAPGDGRGSGTVGALVTGGVLVTVVSW